MCELGKIVVFDRILYPIVYLQSTLPVAEHYEAEHSHDTVSNLA
jgi:hypothetical protein